MMNRDTLGKTTAKSGLRLLAAGVLLVCMHLLAPTSVQAQFCNSAGFVANITPTAVVQSSGCTSGDQRYWTFTATAGVVYNFYTCGAIEQDTYLRIYNGNGGGTQVASADQGCTSSNLSNVTFTAATTGVHSVHLSRYASFINTCANLNSNSTLFYSLIPPPANDDCAGAVVIPSAGPFPYTTAVVDNTYATNGTDPVSTCQASSNRGIWYKYTPAVTGSYVISSCQSAAPSSAITDDILGIYTAASCSGPFTQVACDDDGCTTLANQAVITTNLTCGTQYYILASGWSTTVGNIQFRVTAPACTAAAFSVTGGGTSCASPGVPVGLSGSTLCFNYQLFRGATPLGTLSGTGGALNFGNQTVSGTYTVVSTNSLLPSCTATMTGSAVVTIDATNTDGDGLCNFLDTDDDNDGRLDASDPQPLNTAFCGLDADGDGCDDCAGTNDGFGVAANNFPAADGTDTDGDGLCDLGDGDDDNDGVADGSDNAPLNTNSCQDLDGDGCDDCSGTHDGFGAAANNDVSDDGPDNDTDGLCDSFDTDDDDDGTTDAAEILCGSNPMNAASTCEVCDGADNDLDASVDEGFADTDGDTQADCVDTDDDNDGILDGPDTADLDPDQCEDTDGDGCDDCSQNGGSFAAGANNFPNNDGTDTDSDGQCDFGDTDDDNDGVADGSDNAPLNESSCQDLDGDGCDDCVNGADAFAAGANFDPADDGADFDGDGLCDFGDADDDNDGLSDVAEGGLGTNPFDTDTDDDSFGDATDTCPTVFGQIGSVCDAQAGPGYTLGQLNGSCTCQAVPCTNTLNLVFNPDGVTNIGWELREAGTNTLVQSGGGIYPPAPEYSLPTCLPNGSYYLVVTSDQVGGGIVQGGIQGGYRLETAGGVRLIDNTKNFLSGATSTIAGGQGFDLPAGTDRLIYTSCDKMDWRSNEYIVANDNPVVAAYHGGANAAQTGYEMWFYDPNGGYSFRRFHSHAVSDGYAPNNPQRACHIKVNAWGGVNTIPAQSNLLNVKVRGRIMVGITPTNLPWGPACRLKMDANRAECPLTQLMDVPGSTQLSCGGTRAIGNGAANYVHARPVNRYLGGVSAPANKYQFRFRIPAEFVDITKTSATGQYWVNTMGLAPCKSYKVEVRASFDNGATWCDTYAPANPNPYSPLWGRTCDFNTACAVNGGTQNMAIDPAAGINLYPNPNNGEQLFLSIDMIQAGVEKVTMDIYDTFGKRVSASTIAVNEGFVNTSVDLKGSLAAGMYIVNITAGDAVYTERLVIQP